MSNNGRLPDELTVDDLTDRELEQLSEEELAVLEEPEYDEEALREILRLKPGRGGWPA